MQSNTRNGFVFIRRLQSPHRVATQVVLPGGKEPLQCSLEHGPALLATQRVHLHEQHIAAQDRARQVIGHGQGLGICQRAILAQTLSVDLVKLAVSALLGPLIAEHGPDAVELDNGVFVQQAMLNDRAEYTCRGLGPKRH